MPRNFKREQLEAGLIIVTSEKGNSMTPRIKSNQSHELTPCTLDEVNVDDIVYCKVHKYYYTHLVLAKNPIRGVQIGNNHGRVNGWTKKVFGKVTQIF
jgi:hypothetical protein